MRFNRGTIPGVELVVRYLFSKAAFSFAAVSPLKRRPSGIPAGVQGPL
jgi:hypothetical protein